MAKKHSKKWLLITLCTLIVLGGLYAYYFFRVSNPWNAATIGDIPTPAGYERVESDYADFFRGLPLKPKGSRVMLYTGGKARLQFLSIAVVDMKLLSNDEQCADVAMRMRGEYMYSKNRESRLVFRNVNGEKMRYNGGHNRKSFEKYMRKVYGYCSTYSVYHETKKVDFKDVMPGDVLVYPARKGRKYGHAVVVADVAVNDDGEKMILCVEGNTPARNIHVMKNPNPFRGAWTKVSDNVQYVSVFHFNEGELRRYE